MKRVYRVVDTDNRGPYNSRITKIRNLVFDNYIDCDTAHPGPSTDKGLIKFFRRVNSGSVNQYLFCFSSPESLTKWFSQKEVNAELSKLDVKVIEFEVSTVIEGEKQSMVLISEYVKTEILKETPLSEFTG